MFLLLGPPGGERRVNIKLLQYYGSTTIDHVPVIILESLGNQKIIYYKDRQSRDDELKKIDEICKLVLIEKKIIETQKS